jgi:hypothetical protein
MAKELNEFRRSCRTAHPASRYFRQLGYEGLPLARLISTSPTLNAKLHVYSRALRREVL